MSAQLPSSTSGAAGELGCGSTDAEDPTPTTVRTEPSAQVVDWELATSVGQRWVPGGPELPPAAAAQVVAELRDLAVYAVGPVREVTGLVADPADTPAVVVDRRAWVAHNVAGFRGLLTPSLDRLGARASAPVAAVGSRVTGLELGGVLAYLSAKVLGQFEPFAALGAAPADGRTSAGRLMLVAPNIVAVERALDVVPYDFRLWVCLHEETHRAQFGAVPWLTDHLVGQIRAFLDSGEVSLGDLVRRAGAALRSVRTGGSLLDAVQSPQQRAAVARITGVMSLLEGHADWVMDEVGPQVVPTVATIRAKFDARRRSPSGADAVMRKVLGMDAKLAQYTEGAAFVRGVISRVGPEGFAAVWASPDNLPSHEEITAPARWCTRVLG